MKTKTVEIRSIQQQDKKITISTNEDGIKIEVDDYKNYNQTTIDLDPKNAKILIDSIQWGLSLHEAIKKDA